MPLARLLAVCVAAIAALSVLFRLWLNLPEHGMIGSLWDMLRYFTILTSLIVTIVFAGLWAGRAVSPALIAGTTLWMVMVGIIYHLLLARALGGADWIADQALHTVTPIAAGLWWLILGPKHGLRWSHAVLWTFWPMAYLLYALARGLADGTYPYFFIDPTAVGWPGLLAWVAILWLVFWVAGLAVVALARRLSRSARGPAG